jgi:hypothetical protein
MISEISPQPLAALPVRRRETLEIFDTALKLYRRYFWVLLGWSALVSATSLTAIFSTFLYLFVSPLIYGAVSCCVAAAVRGQSVRFRQCWEFTKPRYGAMLGALFLSWIVLVCVIVVIYIASILIVLAGVALLSNAPTPVVVVSSIVGFLVLLVAMSAMGVFAFGWMTMVPIVSCLEDDKRGVPAMGRSLELLKGNWRRVFGMSLIIGLAIGAVMGIVGGACTLIVGVGSIGAILTSSDDAAFWTIFVTFAAFWAMFLTLWNPAQILIIAVLYLDLRVRREALDLEWTAYASAPLTPTGAVALENPTPGGAPLSAMPQELGASEFASFAAGSGGSVEAPAPAPVEPSEFSAANFSPPVAPPTPAPEAFAPSPAPPSTASESVSPFNSSSTSGISLDKTPESETQGSSETSGENEARREI